MHHTTQAGSSGKRSIAYQNKDIASKIFGEILKNQSLKVYGLDLPEIVQVLPTNLPEISANELRIDNLFLLADGSLAIIDYESKYLEENKVKYLNYIARILERLLRDGMFAKDGALRYRIRVIIIYTADVLPSSTNAVFDCGCNVLTITQAFLSQLDGDTISRKLSHKITSQEALTGQDLMELIVLPLTYRGSVKKQKALQNMVALAEAIPDETDQTFALAGLLVFSDKIIDAATASKIRRCLSMTKVSKLIFDDGFNAGITRGIEESKCSLVLSALDSLSPEEVSALLKLPLKEVLKIAGQKEK